MNAELETTVRVSVANLVRNTLCPYCKEGLLDSESIVCCLLCRTLHHESCWQENDLRCSVFRCNGSSSRVPPVPQTRRWTIASHSLLNAALHYRIHLFGTLVDWLQVPHAFALLAIELLILGTGWAALVKSGFPRSWDHSTDPWDPVAVLSLTGNAAFVLFLLYYLLQNGLHALLALITL